MEKPQLINFIAKVLEDSGFKVYKNFKTSSNVIDIYAILPTTLGDFGVVVGCKNYDKTFEVGVEVLRKMEELQRSVNASKVTVVSSAYFSTQARNYALKKNIKLVDRDALTELARKYQDNTAQTTLDNTPYDGGASQYIAEEYPEYNYDASDMDYIMQRRDANPAVYKNTLYRQMDESPQRSLAGMFQRPQQPQSYRQTNLYNYDAPQFYGDPLFLTLIRNPIVLILLVVVISYLFAFLCSNVFKMDSGISGLIEIIVALFLSYGLSLFTDRSTDFIIKGTFIFFISLILLIILIFV